MNLGLWAAKTGLDAQQTRMAVVSNNLANVNTTGFKRSRASFEDLLYQNVRQAGGQSSQETQLPSGVMLGTGVRVVATAKSFSQGGILQTGNSLDMAVNGRGFFQVLLPDGSLGYTRDGAFQVNGQGEVVTSSGYSLQPALAIPDGVESITIGSDGTVSAKLVGDTSLIQVGNLQLVDFTNTAGLQPRGENMFLETSASGAARASAPGTSGTGTILQGSLEGSNVNVVEELISMIETQRGYEMNSKAISTADEMLQYVNNNL